MNTKTERLLVMFAAILLDVFFVFVFVFFFVTVVFQSAL